MTDGLPPPGAGSPPALPAGSRESTAPGAITGPVVVRDAPVASAPPPLQAQTVPAVVVADPNLPPQQIRLRTDRGDIVIRSDARLPDGAEVIVELRLQKAALLATLRLSTRPADIPTPPQPPQAPQTPVTIVAPGDTLIALVLSGNQLPRTPVSPPVTAEQAAAIRSIILQALGGSTQNKIALPMAVQTAVLASADPAITINQLPAEQQNMLRALLPPAPAPNPPTTTAPATSVTPPAMPAAVLPTALKAPASTPLTGLVKNLLPLLQGLQDQGAAETFAPARAQTSVTFANQPTGVALKVIAFATPPASAPTASGQQISATLIGQTRDGMAVIKTPQADFVLTARIQLPVGTLLTLEVTPLTLNELATRLSSTTSMLPGFDPLNAQSWPALDAARALLMQHQPDAAARLANTLPSPGPRMVPTTLFFLAALRLGQIENWLGASGLQSLRDSGGKSTVDSLTSDFARIARQAGDTLNGEWRGISMPLMYDSQLNQLQLFVRQHKEDGGDSSGGKTTRFIVNLNLSRLGGMQLDGLMHDALPARNIDKRLDMIIRTQDRLSPRIMNDLQAAYTAGMRESTMTGSLEFQAGPRSWVEVGRPKSTGVVA